MKVSKNSLFVVLTMFLVVLLSGCGKKDKSLKELEDAYLPKPLMTLSQSDTTEVLSLVDHYLGCLQSGQFDEAISMLWFMNGDSIVPLPKGLARENISIQQRFKGIRYELESVKFSEEKDNLVRYKVVLFDRKPGDTAPNEVRFSLKPVRQDGKWFLVVLDSQTSPDGVGTKIDY